MTILALLVASTEISHGDPGAPNTGNVTPFRTIKVFYPRPAAVDPTGPTDAESALRQLSARYPLPPQLAPALQSLRAEEFAAVAFLYSFIRGANKLGGGKGEGLFSGAARYSQLLTRLHIVGSQYSGSLFELYASLLNELRITSAVRGMASLLPLFMALPRSVQVDVSAVLYKQAQPCLLAARAWKDSSSDVEQAGEDDSDDDLDDLAEVASSAYGCFDPTGKVAGCSLQFVEAAVPTVSSIGFRHTVFRETLANHLLSETGLGSLAQVSHSGLLPEYVTQLLSNGGNIVPNRQAPGNSEAINQAIRSLFPMIELESGCVPTHMLSPGALSVANWTLCRQNNQFTAHKGRGYSDDRDAADLLTTATNTRGVPPGSDHTRESGQMLYTHTVMKPGSRILLEVRFQPFTSPLARGAAFFALQRWLASGGHIGGRAGSGDGQMQLVELQTAANVLVPGNGAPAPEAYEELADQYAQYVASHREELREALVSGSLGWKERHKDW